MHKALLVQLMQALQQLKKQVANQIIREAIVQFYQTVQLTLFCETHHVVAYWVLALNDSAVV